MVDEKERVLTPEEVAEYLGSTKSWLAQMRYRGDGPRFLKMGRLVRYRERDLIEWLETRIHNRT